MHAHGRIAEAALTHQPRGVAILGSTGSIGTATLRVLDRHRDRFTVTALTSYRNGTLLQEQARAFSPEFVGIVDQNNNHDNSWTCPDTWGTGTQVLEAAAAHPHADIVINAVVGAAGLRATLAALEAGKRVALANKESLVMGGPLVLAARERGNGEIVPVDSEHSAILQCLGSRPASEIRRVILTASGGPFRGYTPQQLASVTIDDALQHPTWSMGRKITIDSATLANKALEVIEAHYLFGLPYDKIDVVVHPQSLVHSFVEFIDGSVLAQIGVPSMELPILYALVHPERIADSGIPQFDPVTHGAVNAPMTFEPVDWETFPALRLGIEAGRAGGGAPAVYNAANEQAVALFLAGQLGFTGIAQAIESALAALSGLSCTTLDDLLDADRQARRHVRELFAHA